MLFTLYAGVSNAATFEDAKKAYINKDYKAAATIWRELASTGNVTAQYNLGLMRDTGQGIEKRVDLAFYWYRNAAAKGNASAQFQLGAMYYKGRGVPKLLVETRRFWRASAELGNRDAQFSLGLFLLRHSKEKNKVALAVSRLKQAAARQHVGAAKLLRVIDGKLMAGKNLPLSELPSVVTGSTSVNYDENDVGAMSPQDRLVRGFKSVPWPNDLGKSQYVIKIGVFDSRRKAEDYVAKYNLSGPGRIVLDKKSYQIYTMVFDTKYDAYGYILGLTTKYPELDNGAFELVRGDMIKKLSP
jgi:TPR repeat protein